MTSDLHAPTRRHLLLAVWPLPRVGVLGAIESEVMAHWQPPLNLIGVSQPWQAQVKKARAMMATAAQAWETFTLSDLNGGDRLQ